MKGRSPFAIKGVIQGSFCSPQHHCCSLNTHVRTFILQVNYNYVKVLAKKRSQIIDQILEATLGHFPRKLEGRPFNVEVAQAIETFFLLDHCMEAEVSQTSKSGSSGGRLYSRSALDDESDQRSAKGVKSAASIFDEAVQNLDNFLKIGGVGQGNKAKGPETPSKGTTASSNLTSPVVPITRKSRKSMVMRQVDENELKEVGEEANLLLDDERPPTELVPSYSQPVPSFNSHGSMIGDLLDNNPIVFVAIAVATITVLKGASKLTVTMDLDVMMLLIWAAFCVGLHTPRPMISGVDKNFGPPSSRSQSRQKPTVKTGDDRDGRKLLRKSIALTPDAKASASGSDATFDSITEVDTDMDEIIRTINSPFPRFPEGAALGSHLNCWSEPDYRSFHVRGATYLKDKVKVESGEYICKARGLDLFLTDTCPENAARYDF